MKFSRELEEDPGKKFARGWTLKGLTTLTCVSGQLSPLLKPMINRFEVLRNWRYTDQPL